MGEILLQGKINNLELNKVIMKRDLRCKYFSFYNEGGIYETRSGQQLVFELIVCGGFDVGM